jgi:hypothetical protein
MEFASSGDDGKSPKLFGFPRSGDLELHRIRTTSRSKILRPFFQRVETWELLLIIRDLEGDGSYGIEDYLDRLQTLKFTRITMRNFIKDRIAEASLIAVVGDKKSRKSLILSDELRSNLNAYFKLLAEIQGWDGMLDTHTARLDISALIENSGDLAK